MANFNFTFTVGKFTNGENIEDSLGGIELPVKRWANLQVSRIVEAFSEGGHGSRGGAQWAAWSPAYAKNRAKVGRTKILVDTGGAGLKGSITYRVQNQKNVGLTVGVEIGTSLFYAPFHQFGTRNMPQRKVIDITKSDKEILRTALDKFADGEING